MAERQQLKIWVSGRVQGVFFRVHTQREADRLGLHGWVRNLSDGRVEALAIGPKPDLQRLLKWCAVGPPMAGVEQVEHRWIPLDQQEMSSDTQAFVIRHD